MDIVERLLSGEDGLEYAAAEEIARLREALERVSTSNNLQFIWEVSKAALAGEEEKG